MSLDNPLFDAYDLGNLTLPNRILMAPLTRNRAAEGNIPTELNAKYYRQRASAGLIITEATQVDPMGQGYPRTPGIHSDAQIDGWQTVTEAVHEANGRIFLQLWHVGRISHSAYHDGGKPVAPSSIKPEGNVLKPDFEEVSFETPQALETDEISAVVDQYGRGAQNAKKAGFDGVEIHAANGYLIDQFLRSGTNDRNDQYGGSIKNRGRFLREVAERVTAVWDTNRVGVRFSPLSNFNDMYDDDPESTFVRAAEIAEECNLGYVHLVEPAQTKPFLADDGHVDSVFFEIREVFNGAIMPNNNYDSRLASRAIEQGYADLVSFGRTFLANPDLPRRIREDLPINVPDESTFYGGGKEGYTDYPTWEEQESGKADVETVDSIQELPSR